MRTERLKDFLAQLPVGFPVRGGSNGETKILREFDLGPVTGRVRLAAGRPDVRDNPGQQSTEMLTLTLRRLGNISPVPKDMVRALSFQDREFLHWIHIVRRLMNNPEAKELDIVCGSCEAKLSAPITADIFLVNVLEDADAQIEEITIGDRKLLIQTFRFEHVTYGALRVRLLTGEDEERFAVLQRTKPEEGTLRSTHAAIVDLDGKAPTFDQYLDLDEDVLAWIQACMGSMDIGASQRLTVSCDGCGGETVAEVSPFEYLGAFGPPKVSPPYATNSSS